MSVKSKSLCIRSMGGFLIVFLLLSDNVKIIASENDKKEVKEASKEELQDLKYTGQTDKKQTVESKLDSDKSTQTIKNAKINGEAFNENGKSYQKIKDGKNSKKDSKNAHHSQNKNGKRKNDAKLKKEIVDVVLERNDHVVDQAQDFDGKPGNPVKPEDKPKNDDYEEYYEVDVKDEWEEFNVVDIDKHFDEHNPIHRQIFATRVYMKHFAKYQITQMEATKSIVNFGTYEKRYQLLERMLNKMFMTFKDVKENVSDWGIRPADPLPDDAERQESVSKIFENTFLFGNLIMRLPDMVQDIYGRKQSWKYTLAWAVHWCMDSKLFNGTSELILRIISAEVGLREKDPNWVPDYSNMTAPEIELVKTYAERDLVKAAKETAVKKQKKEKKKIKRGPRMSHNEL